MKKALVLMALVSATSFGWAESSEKMTVAIEELSAFESTQDTGGSRGGGYDEEDDRHPPISSRRRRNYLDYDQDRDQGRRQDPIERTGEVVSVGKDIVAFGEAVYDLVTKGKPSNQTEYAPVSVVPKDGKSEGVDPFDLEGFSMPVQKNFRARIFQGAKQVVVFDYMVIYSHGGSYQGRGKYLTGASIIPVKIVTKFGWTFNATMRVSGIMNHGTVENPVAGLMLTMNFKANGWAKAVEQNETLHITGRGEVKSYNRR